MVQDMVMEEMTVMAVTVMVVIIRTTMTDTAGEAMIITEEEGVMDEMKEDMEEAEVTAGEVVMAAEEVQIQNAFTQLLN